MFYTNVTFQLHKLTLLHLTRAQLEVKLTTFLAPVQPLSKKVFFKDNFISVQIIWLSHAPVQCLSPANIHGKLSPDVGVMLVHSNYWLNALCCAFPPRLLCFGYQPHLLSLSNVSCCQGKKLRPRPENSFQTPCNGSKNIYTLWMSFYFFMLQPQTSSLFWGIMWQTHLNIWKRILCSDGLNSVLFILCENALYWRIVVAASCCRNFFLHYGQVRWGLRRHLKC